MFVETTHLAEFELMYFITLGQFQLHNLENIDVDYV